MFITTETTADEHEDGVEHDEAQHFQNPDGRLPLSSVDTNARWRTSRPGKLSGLRYQESVMRSDRPFPLSRRHTGRVVLVS